ncbi:MAG TPA: hypothetical protein VG496_06085, partial [Myxococcales bacterium]|nr:hypothetical protein [Myxococcales bacterium]
LPRGIVPTVIALAAVGLLAPQRQRLSETAKWVQRHGVEGTWKFVEHKASQLWASIRRDVQSGISDAKHASATPATPSRTPSHDSATRGTHRRTQLASGTKRKSGSRQRDDIGTPGSTP